MSIFLEGDSDNFKINNQAFFKWNDSKVSDYLEKNPLSSGEFPDDTIDVSFFDKKYLFCCYKQQLNCDDDPDSPKVYFCKKISLPY